MRIQKRRTRLKDEDKITGRITRTKHQFSASLEKTAFSSKFSILSRLEIQKKVSFLRIEEKNIDTPKSISSQKLCRFESFFYFSSFNKFKSN
jgi:hypothetical protein